MLIWARPISPIYPDVFMRRRLSDSARASRRRLHYLWRKARISACAELDAVAARVVRDAAYAELVRARLLLLAAAAGV